MEIGDASGHDGADSADRICDYIWSQFTQCHLRASVGQLLCCCVKAVGLSKNT